MLEAEPAVPRRDLVRKKKVKERRKERKKARTRKKLRGEKSRAIDIPFVGCD